jgi:hypothetical protein
MFSGPPTCNSKPRARARKSLYTRVSSKGVKPVSGHLLESRVSNTHPTAPIKFVIHPINPIKPGTTMGKPLPSHWRSTSVAKERPWSVAPLRLKTATSPKLVLITRWRTSSKLNTTKLKVLTICSTTKRTEPSSITTKETKLSNNLPSTGLTGHPDKSGRWSSASSLSPLRLSYLSKLEL